MESEIARAKQIVGEREIREELGRGLNSQVIKRTRQVSAATGATARLTGTGCSVGGGNTDRVDRMTDNVVAENDVVNGTAGAGTPLVLGIEENRCTLLSLSPVVLEDVALDKFANPTFIFEQVLHGKSNADVGTTVLPPRKQL